MKLKEVHTSMSILWEVVFIVLFSGSRHQSSAVCREAIFKPTKDPVLLKIIKNVRVNSVLECAHHCRATELCEAFKHKNIQDKINCQVSTGKPKYMTDENEDKQWTVYTTQITPSQQCLKSSCHGAGRCILDSCATEGFKCECDADHYGKYCENEYNDDYDVTFTNITENDYISGIIAETEFNAFTFCAWIKFNPGFINYPLLSYQTNDSSETIALMFDTANQVGETTARFSGNLFGKIVRTATIPVNDDHWHHVGFSWSGVTGEWNLLIDGVLWATRTQFTGMIVPSGGVFTIGHVEDSTNNGIFHNLVGTLSRVNVWSAAKTGSEIEEFAKSPGGQNGDLLSWMSITDYIAGDLGIIRPSTAAFSGNGTNYEITLPFDNHTSYPGPRKGMKKLSSCLWYKATTSDPVLFVVYDIKQPFLFGYFPATNTLVSLINNININSTVAGTSTAWHFLCLQWNGLTGTVTHFYDGFITSDAIQNEALKTELPAKEHFILRLDTGKGTLTQLNIWNYAITPESIIAMSSGGFNVHGNMLSWSFIGKRIDPSNMVQGSSLYLPGYTVLAKRTKWCNDAHPTNNICLGQFLARFGGHKIRKNMNWRCYCPVSLYSTQYTYNFTTNSADYYSRHDQLSAINK